MSRSPSVKTSPQIFFGTEYISDKGYRVTTHNHPHEKLGYRSPHFDSHHPSYPKLRGESKQKDYYNEMREAVQAFFKEYPKFLQTKKDERE